RTLRTHPATRACLPSESTMRLRSLPLFLVFAALATFGVARASAQAPEPTGAELEPRRIFAEARAAYERELYTEAEDRFLAAYEAMPTSDARRPLILLNVA